MRADTYNNNNNNCGGVCGGCPSGREVTRRRAPVGQRVLFRSRHSMMKRRLT